MINYIAIYIAILSGIFILIGYFVQRHIEHRRHIKLKRIEAYSMFLKTSFKNMDLRTNKMKTDRAEEVYWKTQIALYGSDSVIKAMHNLNKLLPNETQINFDYDSYEEKILFAYNNLLLSMRKDTVRKTLINLDEIKGVSPIISD